MHKCSGRFIGVGFQQADIRSVLPRARGLFVAGHLTSDQSRMSRRVWFTSAFPTTSWFEGVTYRPTFGGVYVACVYSHAGWELPYVIQVSVAMSLGFLFWFVFCVTTAKRFYCTLPFVCWDQFFSFYPSQPQRIKSGLTEIFIKRCRVERTSKAELRSEEQGEKKGWLSGGSMEWNTAERAIKTEIDTRTEWKGVGKLGWFMSKR